MGVNVRIYIRKDQLKRLFDFDNDYFYFLMFKLAGKRWNHFEEMFDLGDIDIVTSKELLKRIALNPKLKLESRSWWVNILSEYDLIFTRDTLKTEELKERIENLDEYIDLVDFEYEVIEKVRKEIISKV